MGFKILLPTSEIDDNPLTIIVDYNDKFTDKMPKKDDTKKLTGTRMKLGQLHRIVIASSMDKACYKANCIAIYLDAVKVASCIVSETRILKEELQDKSKSNEAEQDQQDNKPASDKPENDTNNNDNDNKPEDETTTTEESNNKPKEEENDANKDVSGGGTENNEEAGTTTTSNTDNDANKDITTDNNDSNNNDNNNNEAGNAMTNDNNAPGTSIEMLMNDGDDEKEENIFQPGVLEQFGDMTQDEIEELQLAGVLPGGAFPVYDDIISHEPEEEADQKEKEKENENKDDYIKQLCKFLPFISGDQFDTMRKLSPLLPLRLMSDLIMNLITAPQNEQNQMTKLISCLGFKSDIVKTVLDEYDGNWRNATDKLLRDRDKKYKRQLKSIKYPLIDPLCVKADDIESGKSIFDTPEQWRKENLKMKRGPLKLSSLKLS